LLRADPDILAVPGKFFSSCPLNAVRFMNYVISVTDLLSGFPEGESSFCPTLELPDW
jgi:hypothetical protein